MMMVLIECPSISLCVQVEGSRVVVGVRKKFEETRIGEFRRAHARMHAIDFQAGWFEGLPRVCSDIEIGH